MSEHAFDELSSSSEPPREDDVITLAQAATNSSEAPPALKGRVIWTEGAGTTPAKDGECGGAPQETIDPKLVTTRFVATDGASITLPEGAHVTKIIVVGDDVYLVQSDGKIVLVEDAASEGAKVIADGKDVLSGPLKDCGMGGAPDGEGSATSDPEGSGGGVLQSFGDIQEAFPYSPLLPPTQLFEKPIKEYGIPGSSGSGNTPPPVDGKPSAGDAYVHSDDDDVKCGDCGHGEGEGEVSYGEDGPSCGAGNETGDDPTSGLTGTLPHSFGPDGAGEITFAGMNGENAPFTAGGEPVSYVWTAATNTLSAITLSGEVVFTVSVNPQTGDYEFTQFKAVDHHTPANVDDTQELNVDFTLSYTVTDADGDTATGTLHVSIDDDTPGICKPQNGYVDEDQIACGNKDSDCTAGDIDAASETSGSLGIKWGADCYDASSADEVSTINVVGDRDVAFKDSCVHACDANGNPIATLTSGGVPLEYCLNADATKLTATADGKVIFEVTLNDDGEGSYTFKLYGPLDHAPTGHEQNDDLRLASYESEDGEGCTSGQSYEETITLEFCFTAHDSDLDKVDGSFKVFVNDDAPTGSGETLTLTVDEDGLEGANADGKNPGAEVDGGGKIEVCGNLNALVSIGADKGATFSFVHDIVEKLNGIGLSSGGCALSFAVCDGTLTAYAGETPAFTLTLTSDGHVTFNLLENLDHPQPSSDDECGSCAFENTIDLDFSQLIQVSDHDGDTILLCNACTKGGEDEASLAGEEGPSEGCFVIKIVDDVPQICTPENGRVDEDALPKGNHDDCRDDGASVCGDLGIKWGADDANSDDGQCGSGDRSVTFCGDPVVTACGEEICLTSKGHPVTYQLCDDGRTLIASACGEEVFKVTLSDDGSGKYTFELLGQLDHPNPNFEDDLDIAFSFKATDSDGDCAKGTFTITVNDDKPVVVCKPICVSVYEEGLVSCDKTEDGGQDTPSQFPTFAHGTLVGLVAVGADSPPTFSFASDAVELAGYRGLTSGGVCLNYVIEGDTFIAKAGNETIFTLKVCANGSYTFCLEGNLDHSGDTIELHFSKLIMVSDADGDSARLSDCGCGSDFPNFVVKIVDDVPQICTPENGRVDEDALPKGNHDDCRDDGASVCGDLGIKWGADDANSDDVQCGSGDRSVTFCGDPVVTACGEEICLTSKGHPVTYQLCDDGRTLIASACGEEVFKVTLSDDGSGKYTFELLGQLDHPNPNFEDNLDIAFSFKATDSDGDCAKGTFTITVNDDSPVASCVEPLTYTVYEDGIETSCDHGDDHDHHHDDRDDHDRGHDHKSGNDGNLVTVVNGSLAALVSVGADCHAHFSFVEGAECVMLGQNLTSNNKPLSYCIEDNSLVATADGTAIFTLTLEADGTFKFVLEGNLDHPDTCTADEIPLDFSNIISVSDADGDSTLLCDCAKGHGEDGCDDDGDAEGCFVIKVVDSVPHVSSERICVTVDEDDLATLKCDKDDHIVSGSRGTSPGDGGGDGSYTLDNGGVIPAHKIDLSKLVSFGADQPGAFGIVIPNGSTTLKSKGETLSFKSYDTDDDGIDDKLVAKAGDRQVFTLEVGVITGLVLFTLLDQIDHAYAQGSNSVPIDIGSFLTAIDSDGDHASLAGAVEVKVIDDVPGVLDAENAHLDNAPYSYEEFSLGSNGKIGADDVGKVYFVDKDGNASNNFLQGTDGQFITYNGTKIALTGYDTGTLVGTAGGTKVLEIKLNPDQCDECDDVYSVKLFKELDDAASHSHAFGTIKSGSYDALTIENIDNSGISLRVTGYDDGDGDKVNVSGVGMGVGNQGIGKDEMLQFDFFKDANGNHAYGSNEAFEVTSFTFAVTQNNPTYQNVNFEIYAYDKSGNKIELEIGDLTFNPGSAAHPNTITVEESGKGLLVKGVNGGNGGIDLSDDLFTLKNFEGFSKITIEYDDKSTARSFDVTLKSFGVEEARDLAFNFDIEAKDYDGDKSAIETVKVSLDGSSGDYDDGHSSQSPSSYASSFLDDGSEDLYDDVSSSSHSSQPNVWEFSASLPPPPPCACEEQVSMAA